MPLLEKGNDILILGSLDLMKEGATMNTRNWIFAALVVLALIAIYSLFFRPGAEEPTEAAAPPATTEQPVDPAPAE